MGLKKRCEKINLNFPNKTHRIGNSLPKNHSQFLTHYGTVLTDHHPLQIYKKNIKPEQPTLRTTILTPPPPSSSTQCLHWYQTVNNNGIQISEEYNTHPSQLYKQDKQTYSPRNGICEEKVPKELCHIPEFVCLKTMDCVIL